jgi:hypothetical protein
VTSLREMTFDEIAAHGAAISASRTDDEFVTALSAYVKDVVERETEPYTKIALFVRGMLEGLLGPRICGLPTSGSARVHVTRVDPGPDRPSYVGTCACGWMGTPYYWSNLTIGVSEELARSKAEEQCEVHVLAVEWCVAASISNTPPSRRS